MFRRVVIGDSRSSFTAGWLMDQIETFRHGVKELRNRLCAVITAKSAPKVLGRLAALAKDGVHNGQAAATLQMRAAVVAAAHARHPKRFAGGVSQPLARELRLMPVPWLSNLGVRGRAPKGESRSFCARILLKAPFSSSRAFGAASPNFAQRGLAG